MSKQSVNNALLIGRLGRDPELRYTTAGSAVCTFSLATDDSYKDKDGNEKQVTDWHNIVAYRKLAEICGQYLKKGALVCVQGKIKTREYADKNGIKHRVTEIIIDDMRMLGTQSSLPETPQEGDAF